MRESRRAVSKDVSCDDSACGPCGQEIVRGWPSRPSARTAARTAPWPAVSWRRRGAPSRCAESAAAGEAAAVEGVERRGRRRGPALGPVVRPAGSLLRRRARDREGVVDEQAATGRQGDVGEAREGVDDGAPEGRRGEGQDAAPGVERQDARVGLGRQAAQDAVDLALEAVDGLAELRDLPLHLRLALALLLDVRRRVVVVLRAADLHEELGPPAPEVGVLELPARRRRRPGVRVRPQLAEPVEVQLPHERPEVVVLEVLRNDLRGEDLRVQDHHAVARLAPPAHAPVQRRDHRVRLRQEGRRLALLAPPPRLHVRRPAAALLAALRRRRRLRRPGRRPRRPPRRDAHLSSGTQPARGDGAARARSFPPRTQWWPSGVERNRKRELLSLRLLHAPRSGGTPHKLLSL